MVLPDIYPSPGSLDLGQLVQDRLKRVNQQFPALAPTTLEDFRRVADELSTISDVCQATIKRLAAQDGVYDATKALDETERALDWAVCMSPTKNVRSSTNQSYFSSISSQSRPCACSTGPSLPRPQPACYGSPWSVHISCSEDTV